MEFGWLAGAMQKTGKFVWSIYRYYFPPRFGYQAAPKNILELIQPFTYRLKVVNLLGHPHSNDGDRAAYRFRNALLQINYKDDHIDTVALAALNTSWPNRFEIFPLLYVMGKNTFEDVVLEKKDSTFFKNSSSKFYSLYTEEYFGFPGRYLYFQFGVISAATYPPLGLGLHFPDGVYKDPPIPLSAISQLKFNIVSLSRSSTEYIPFDWEIFS